jgi:tetratricopeptide (TPR) repeat protein
MSDRPSEELDSAGNNIAAGIDEVCRRFSADWGAGRRPRIVDYLIGVSHEAGPALRAELEALQRKLRQGDETVACGDAGLATVAEPQTAPPPAMVAEAPTIAPRPQPTTINVGIETSPVHDEVTMPPSNPPRSSDDQATAALGGQDPSATHSAPGPTCIRYFGDYEITRELARGGMGIVFLARQISLNRPVALKMILAGQLANETDVKRFYTEAEAAAILDHPGIVPIHEVGQHDGQHYFSMGFVEGQSLAQRLADGPLPPYEAAALMVKVADAIAYAHGRGVIHRDLKPGNILLDTNGNPRVTDFGLAKKVEGDSALTASGQIMGTPSYMPPEQAGGNRAAVGPAADVYALGATLYALVTGRPPFQAATAMDTVIQVIGEEPVPPRRLNPGVPRDLETICLKCLQKEPARRYGSASALAGELRRYLSGEPILARPVGSAERAWRWSKRNRLAASLLTLVAILTASGTATITVLWLRADRSRREAVAAGERTKQALGAAVAAGARADRARAEAVTAGQRAIANAATARRAVNDYLDRITESPQLLRPGLIGVRRDLLTQALTYYEGFLRESATAPDLRAEAAAAQNRAAMILNELGDTNRAIETGRRAVALYEQLVRDDPEDSAYRHGLATSLSSLANGLRTTRRADEALAAYRRSAEIHEAMLRVDPGNNDAAADLGACWSNIANVLGNAGRTQESEALLARNRTHLEDLVRRVPDAVAPRNLLAGVLHSLGNHAADRGKFDEARGLYLRALEIREAITREHADNWEQQSQLARLYNELGLLHFHFQHPDEALSYYQKSRALREKLLAAEPASAELQEYLARSLENLGNLYNSLGRASEALPDLERVRELRARLVSANPGNSEMESALGGSLHNLAMSYERLGRDGEAERLYREAIGHQRHAREVQPEHMTYRLFLTNHLMSLGELLRRAGKSDETAKLAEEGAGLWPRNPQQLLRPALLLAACVESAGPADTPETNARRDRFGKSAVEILTRAFDAGFRDPGFYRTAKPLETIRGRDDFQALLRRLDSSAGVTTK